MYLAEGVGRSYDETTIESLRSRLGESGANYCVGQFAFGDLTQAEVMRSVELFVREVMPALDR